MLTFILSRSCCNVLGVGRHRLARKRRKSSVVLAALLATGAISFVVGGDVGPFTAPAEAKAVIDDVTPNRLEFVAAEANLPHSAAGLSADRQPAASRYHVRSRFLPVELAPE